MLRLFIHSTMREVVLITIFSLLYHNARCDGLLNLSPLIGDGKHELARLQSKVEADKFLGLKSHSGFITVNEEFNSNLFFWFFPRPDEELKEKPWIIWLQGGPGFSSLKGLFDIVGPLKVEDGNVVLRNTTWASSYSMLFLDNPVGAGFSFTDNHRGYPQNEDDVGSQLYICLQQFLQMFPELREAPLFIAGESYAGKYVPALAIQIHKHRNTTHPVNLKGISIGNGMVDPSSVMQYSTLLRALGLMDEGQLAHLQQLEESASTHIQHTRMVDAANAFNATIEYIKSCTGVNIYNLEQDPDDTPTAFEAFINQPEVRELIHVGNASFHLNNQLVYQMLLPDIMNSTLMWVEELLEHYGVMCYSGQLDLMLPYSLTRRAFDKLQWSRRDEFTHAVRKRLRKTEGGTVVGYKQSGGNLVDILVRRAGHMVPKDQPEVANFIIDSFIDEFTYTLT